MPYHHLALATHDMKAIDIFYSQMMGFDLVKVEIRPTPEGGGFAKHFFYDTGNGEMMAFWEIHDDSMPQDFKTGMSSAVGLPLWINHLAFDPGSMDELQSCKKRWLDNGYDVLEIDHNWCYSIYTTDPNGTMVEWCITTGEFGDAERERAKQALTDDGLPHDDSDVQPHVHRAEGRPLHKRA